MLDGVRLEVEVERGRGAARAEAAGNVRRGEGVGGVDVTTVAQGFEKREMNHICVCGMWVGWAATPRRFLPHFLGRTTGQSNVQVIAPTSLKKIKGAG